MPAVVLALLVVASAAHAQTNVTFVPSVSISQVYDDNLFAEQQGSAGRMLQVRPSFEANWESPRLTFLSLYSFDMLRSNHSDLNTFDARRHAFVDTRVRTSPFTTLGLAARYDRTETPGELNIETGVLTDRRQAERFQVTPSLMRRIGTRVVMSASYDWTMENLVDTPTATLQQARLGLAREFSPRVSSGASYLVRYFSDPLDEHISHALLATWERDMAPGTRLSFQAGPRVSSYGGVAPELSGTFTRRTNRVNMALNYWHGETIVLGIVGPVAVDGGMARITWPVTLRTEFGFHAGVNDVETLDLREARIYRGSLVGSWTPTGTYSLAASYDLDFQRGDIRRRLDEEVLRHVFRVSFTVAPRLNRSILPPEEAARVKGASR